MIGHEFDSALKVESVNGQAYLVSNDARIIGLRAGMLVEANQVMLTGANSSVIVSSEGQRFVIDDKCASCLVPFSESDISVASQPHSLTFNDEAYDDNSLANLDVAQLQQLILDGIDPTELFEEAAAGGEGGSSNAGFVVVEYLNAATLTEAGFDTLGPNSGGDNPLDFLGGDDDDGFRRVGDDGSGRPPAAPPRPDIDAEGGQSVALSITEGDLDDASYGAPAVSSFEIEGGTENLLPGSLQIAPSDLAAFEAELATLTSNGEPVVFTRQTSVDSNGVGTFVLTGTANGETVVTLTLVATQNGTGLSVNATLQQFAPLDHKDGTGTYVNVDGNTISINMPLQVADSGGDLMNNPATISMESNDGGLPAAGTAQVEMVEPNAGPDEEQTASTSDGIDLGSDEIASIIFDATEAAAQFAGVTSHGHPTEVSVSADGSVITLKADYDGDGTFEETTLEISLTPSTTSGEPPKFEVKQYHPIDQPDDGTDDKQHDFVLPYKVVDADGDESGESTVTFVIKDGEIATGGEQFDSDGNQTEFFALQERQTPNTYDASADPNETEGTVEIKAASDRLLPDTISIDDVDAFKEDLMLLKNNEGNTIDNVTITTSPDGKTITILATIGSEPALEIVLTASQAADDLSVDVATTFKQYQALIHPSDASDHITNEDYVSVDDKHLDIHIPLQLEDTDGNKLVDANDQDTEAPQLISLRVVDDDSTTFGITSTEPVVVEESSIDDGTGENEGSQSAGTLNIDTEDDSGEAFDLDPDNQAGDDIDNFFFKSDYVTYPLDGPQAGDTVTASGFPVFLDQRPENSTTYPKTYFGVAFDEDTGDNRDVFKVTLNQDGTFEFELLSALDHQAGDGENTLTFELSAFTVDADGDESGKIRVPITVKDDVPRTQDTIEVEVVDSSSSTVTASVDVFNITDPTTPSNITDLQGADGARISHISFDGTTWIEVRNRSNEEIDLVHDGEVIGVIKFNTRDNPGEMTFEFNANIDNPVSVLEKPIHYRVTDGDGDTAEGEVTLTLKDQAPIITVTTNADGEIEGVEDQGQLNTDTEDGGVDATNGIPINVQLNIGDNDLGEAYDDAGQLVLDGEVTIMPKDVTDVGGTFYFNGTEIPQDGDGNIVLSSNMFTASGTTAPIIFTLQNVTFIPDPDYSDYNNTDLIKFDVEVNVNGHDAQTQSDLIKISVEGVADTPSVSLIGDAADGVFELKEDFDPFGTPLTDPAQFVMSDLISASLQDTDGSETLKLEFTLNPDSGSFQGGQIVKVGDTWVLNDPSRLNQVRFIPEDDFSGDIELGIKAISTEGTPVQSGSETAEATETLTLHVEPVADDARLVVRQVVGSEDAGNADPDLAEGDAISLANAISLTTLGTDDDGSESLFVRISDIPDGATLQLNKGGTLTTLSDTDRVSVDDIQYLEFVPPVHSNETVTLKVEGIVVDSATNSPDDERIITAQDLDIRIKGVADDPVFSVANPGTDEGEWQYDADTGVVSTTVPEDGVDGDGLVAIDFEVVSGEKALAATDTSETITMILTNVPDGVTFVTKNGSDIEDVELAFAGWTTDGSGMSVPTYSVDVSVFSGGDVYLKIPPHSTEDIQIGAKLVATENDGDVNAIETTIEVKIDPPVIDTNDNYVNSETQGNEDAWFEVNWQPNLAAALTGAPDSTAQGVQETVVGATISGFASTDSVRLVKGADTITLTPDASGTIEITEAQLADGYRLEMMREADSDADLVLTTKVTVRQEDFEGNSTAEKEINGTVNVDIRAVVEPDGNLSFVDDMGAPISELSTDAMGQLKLENAIDFIHDDPTSEESPLKVYVSDLPEGFFVTNAVYDGDEGWVLNDPDDFTIVAPPNTPLTQTTFTLSALVTDKGDNSEGDTSLAEPVSTTVTLNYQNASTDATEAQAVGVPASIDIDGDEDNPISLEALGNAVTWPSGTTGDVEFDYVTVVINGDDIPAGTVIGGAFYHLENDTYVFEVPGRVDTGNPYASGFDLSGLTITAPDDYAGTLNIPVTFVSLDSKSGDTEETTTTVNLNVRPLVDVAPPTGDDQPSDNTLTTEFTLTVKETQGLNSEQQPLEPGDTETVVSGEALEDGVVILTLGSTLADTDQANGEEKVTSVTLEVTNGAGKFQNAAGDLVDSITLPEPPDTEVGDIKFVPNPDYSGDVSISASLTITDTATTGTDSKDIDTDFSFEVKPVHDTVTFTDDGTDLGDTDVLEVETDEDNSVSLADLGIKFVDTDGSEKLESVLINNVPNGFTLSSPALNAGNGQWLIPATAISDVTSLSQITVNPPADFSGDVQFSVTVFTSDSGVINPDGFSQTVEMTVNPVGDGANANVVATASGVEDSDIDLELEISARDDSDSVGGTQPPGAVVNENDPETLLITVSGVPAGGKLVLPAGVDGTVTPETSTGGDVQITINAQQLNDLTFVPPADANGQFVLDLAIQTVDNGEVSADVVNKQVTVNISAVNDEPVNILADSYEFDEGGATITDLQISDVDAADGTGIMNVELVVGTGSSLAIVGDSTGISVTGDGSNKLVLEGDIDAINTLLAAGIEYNYTSEDASGTDSLTMTTRDRGNTGSGGQKFDKDTVSIVVLPKADTPELNAAPQLASMRAATGALVPLLGLMATLVEPVDDEFTLTFDGLGTVGQLVDASGTPVGTDNGDGSWTLNQTELQTLTLEDLNLTFSGQPTGAVTIIAKSDVGDGDPKEATMTLNVNVVDTSTTPTLNDDVSTSGNADLVVDGNQATQVYGGVGEDVIAGGLGEDILTGGTGDDEAWGGDIGGTGDGVKDTFKWESGDFGMASAASTDVIKDFETGVDVIDISGAFNTTGMFTFTDLANRLDIQTVGDDTRIQIFDDASAPIQNIIVEGVTLNELLGMDRRD
ncbi:retention module-containing protein [Enterovibrio coralii]|uniref:retention module-containing protein n=1 Tax=Enterovibrio coralii TaxID=294935 RepID=UPI000A936333|nr:retention module-containing protein [Enterovibrio coralii]